MSAPTAASAPLCWWLAYPDAWAAEQAALAAAGAIWSDDTPEDPDNPADPAAEVAGAGLTLRVEWPHPVPRAGDPATLTLRATYPATYPWFAPRVSLPEPLPGLLRHRNPIKGSLCLLADPDDWRPGTTLADLLTIQLPRLLAAGRDASTAPATLALEAGAEAAWTRTRLSLGALLVDSGGLPPAEVPGGWADVVRISKTLAPVSALVTLLDAEHRLLWESRAFGLREANRIPWVRLSDPTAETGNPDELWRRATALLTETVPDGRGTEEPNAMLVLVPSEAAQRRPCEEWMLLARAAPRPEGLEAAVEQAELTGKQAREAAAGDQLSLFDAADLPVAPASAPVAGSAPAPSAMPVRALRSYPIGHDDLTARLPDDTARLAGTSVTIVGVGALGGPLALELARAGVGRLHVIDGDTHDPATGSRQLLTLRDAGCPKALAVALRIVDSNPHAQLTVGLRDVGADDGRELPGLLASTLVIDCAANPAATRYLAAHLRAVDTPLLVAAATAGGWGGTIVTLPADGGGCWECLQLHRADRTVPWPPARSDGGLTPVGCSQPTYVGGYFDLGMVALQAARTALARLSAPRTVTRGRVAGWRFGDLQVLTQYRHGRPVHPRWQARGLTVHPACPLHRTGPGGIASSTPRTSKAGVGV